MPYAFRKCQENTNILISSLLLYRYLVNISFEKKVKNGRYKFQLSEWVFLNIIGNMRKLMEF